MQQGLDKDKEVVIWINALYQHDEQQVSRLACHTQFVMRQ